MKKTLFALSLILCQSVFADTKQRFDSLLDDIWEYGLQTSPISATRMGRTDSNHLLPDLSPQSIQQQTAMLESYMEKLDVIDPAELDRSRYISWTLQKLQLQNDIDYYKFNSQMIPFTSESGFYSSLAFLPSTHRFINEKDYEDYLARLAAFPKYFEQNIMWMKKGIEIGMTQPREVLDPMPSLIGNYIVDNVEDSPFFRPFISESHGTLEANTWDKLRDKAQKVIASDVISAYSKLKVFVEEEYLPNAKRELGAISWPNGKEYYQNRAAFYTTTQLSAEEIHQLGLSEVKRIRQEMKQVMKDLDFKGSHAEFIHFLRTDPQFYAKTEREIMQYAAYLSKKMDAKLPKLFSHLPRTPYGVQPVPANIAPNYTTGRYISPSNETEPGYYWVNTYALDKRPLYALPALTLHEAVPGHHLQIALSRELEGLPNVRRYTYISAFGEGWGLYSEYLGKEVDFYETLYDEFGRLSYEMWRASRLVVDTGMHMKGWSRQQAVQFMLENTALSEHNVRTEVDRYITWPGQALSYKIGELTIKRLRQKAEEKLGNNFDIRAFHKAVLEHGSVPLTVLEENIDIFIERVLQTND